MRGSRVVVNIVLLVVAVLFVAPLLWLLTASFDAHGSLSAQVPNQFTLANFGHILTWDIGGRPLLNGLFISGGAAIIVIVVSVLAAYPLSRYQLRFRRPFLYTILFTTGLPVTAIMVPVYGLFVRLQLVDTLWGTTVFLAATALPMAIWMCKNFMDGIPVSLEEAAWVDGASSMQALRSIVLPLMAPGVAVVGIFTFIQAWGNFFVPFVLLLDPAKLPASVNIYNFFGQNGMVAYGQLAAYSILYTAPVLGLYLVVSRWLGGGFSMAGAVKA